MDVRLSEHFLGVGFKRLTAVDCVSEGRSNQHELNSSSGMRELLGAERQTFGCRYLRLEGVDDVAVTLDEMSTITYYNSREGKERAPEFRLTYPASSVVMSTASEGDLCWVLRLTSAPNQLLLVLAEGDSRAAHQLDRLLGTDLRHSGTASGMLQLGDLQEAPQTDLLVDDSEVLTALGVAARLSYPDLLDEAVGTLAGSGVLPTTKDLAEFVRHRCCHVDVLGDPDRALLEWYSASTEVYFGLEKHLIGPIIDDEFANQPSIDLDRFFAVATKYKNGRFSRAGATFEDHWSALLSAHGVTFQSLARRSLPDGSRPDFLMPGLDSYLDPDVPEELLTFLAAKTTTKERWLQVVGEAPRLRTRYLATLDQDLNESTLATMQQRDVYPVLPTPIIDSAYPWSTSDDMLTVLEFTERLRECEQRLVRDGYLLV